MAPRTRTPPLRAQRTRWRLRERLDDEPTFRPDPRGRGHGDHRRGSTERRTPHGGVLGPPPVLPRRPRLPFGAAACGMDSRGGRLMAVLSDTDIRAALELRHLVVTPL